MRVRVRALLFALPLISAAAASAEPQSCTGTSSGNVPIIDLTNGSYQGFSGGLYEEEESTNSAPEDHMELAMEFAGEIRPLDPNGVPDPVTGKIVLLSVGMSNTFHHFAHFERQEDVNPQRNPRVVILNGAQGGKAAEFIRDPNDNYWALLSNRLAALGLSEQQVQAVWLQELNVDPPNNFPVHAQGLRDDLEQIVQILRSTFPNLKLCYLSDRSYGGYTTTISPEPQAYETGFAVKWLIADQINGKKSLNPDPDEGKVRAPVLLWGPYLWADGVVANSLGTRWCACDFEGCGNVHPSPSGEQKAGDMLSAFFATDPTARSWYLGSATGSAGLAWRDAEADTYVASAQASTNFGASPFLLSEASPAAHSYVRFDVSGVQRPVLHAKLSLRNPENHISSDDRDVRIVPDSSWDEATVTWLNRPTPGVLLGTIPRATRDGTRSLDVTSAVNADADGIVTFAILAPTGGSASLVRSREDGAPPRLVMITGASAPPQVYCTAGVSASGCAASIGATGVASATAPQGFVLTATNVEGKKSGLFYYGTNGRQASPWGSGTSFQCVVPPVKRGGTMAPRGLPSTCSGSFALDLNARWCPACSHPNHNPGAGAIVQAQLWYRDPQNTSNQTTSLSDALEFTVFP